MTTLTILQLIITKPNPWPQIHRALLTNRSQTWRIYDDAKGFTSSPEGGAKRGNTSTNNENRKSGSGDEDDDDKIPNVVWERMISRILFYVGVPASIESCSTSRAARLEYRPPIADRPYDLVGVALFGDVAGAMTIGCDPHLGAETLLFELHTSLQRFLPETEKIIDGRLTEEGISFRLDRELLRIIEDNVQDFCDELMGFCGTDVDYNGLFWAVHPGGPAIQNKMEKKLQLLPEKLSASRRALADYGNASSNTIVYVLEYILEETKRVEEGQKLGEEWRLILAFGPGITFEGIVTRNLTI